MRVIECNRNHCTLSNGKHIHRDGLRHDYRCRACDGRIEFTAITEGLLVVGYEAKCGLCGGEDFIHNGQVRDQEVDAAKVLVGLPVELQRRAMKTLRSRQGDDDERIKDAAAALYGG
jgi:hypothetical protein